MPWVFVHWSSQIVDSPGLIYSLNLVGWNSKLSNLSAVADPFVLWPLECAYESAELIIGPFNSTLPHAPSQKRGGRHHRRGIGGRRQVIGLSSQPNSWFYDVCRVAVLNQLLALFWEVDLEQICRKTGHTEVTWIFVQNFVHIIGRATAKGGKAGAIIWVIVPHLVIVMSSLSLSLSEKKCCPNSCSSSWWLLLALDYGCRVRGTMKMFWLCARRWESHNILWLWIGFRPWCGGGSEVRKLIFGKKSCWHQWERDKRRWYWW